MHNLVEILDIFIFTNKKTNKSKYRPICQQSEKTIITIVFFFFFLYILSITNKAIQVITLNSIITKEFLVSGLSIPPSVITKCNLYFLPKPVISNSPALKKNIFLPSILAIDSSEEDQTTSSSSSTLNKSFKV